MKEGFKPTNPENFEREIIRDPAEPELAEFGDLRNEFFKACKDVKTKSTHWIIELQKVEPNDTLKDVVAIGKNKGEGLDHIVIVFTKWWPSYVEQLKREGYTCKSLNVYSNYSPCAECAPVLSEWLNDHKDVEMSIFYAFVYDSDRFGSPAQYEDGWKQLQNTKNVVEIQDFDTSSLRDLAQRVNYQAETIENIYVADNHWRKHLKEKVNKKRINRAA